MLKIREVNIFLNVPIFLYSRKIKSGWLSSPFSVPKDFLENRQKVVCFCTKLLDFFIEIRVYCSFSTLAFELKLRKCHFDAVCLLQKLSSSIFTMPTMVCNSQKKEVFFCTDSKIENPRKLQSLAWKCQWNAFSSLVFRTPHKAFLVLNEWVITRRRRDLKPRHFMTVRKRGQKRQRGLFWHFRGTLFIFWTKKWDCPHKSAELLDTICISVWNLHPRRF